MNFVDSFRRFALSLLIGAFVLLASACGDRSGSGEEPFLIVVGAFPGELVALLQHTNVEETVEIDGKQFRVGTMAGVRVAVGMTGIGLVNAANTTRAALDRFDDATGVIMSGVAGSYLKIGDVAVPETWRFADGSEFATDPAWLEVAREVERSGSAEMQRCTEIPADPSQEVCLLHDPAVYVGGVGQSDDPFGGGAFRCQPEGDDVFACDVPLEGFASRTQDADDAWEPKEAVPIEFASVDMETTAVARETIARGLPFIAFRAVSDGPGDPLNLPGFPAQFFVYYRLAARNAAAAVVAFLDRL